MGRSRWTKLSAPCGTTVLVVDARVLAVALAGGHLDARRAVLALGDLQALALSRVPSLRLVARCWELRDSLTVYDAAYVALSEALEVPLLTGDARLARAPGVRGDIEVLKGAVHD